MDTPICDFVREYAEKDSVRLHMPGHKGVDALGCERLDITEISGADVLYHANGIIKRSEENAAKLFGTAKTIYSCEGSSLSIRAMLYLIKLYAVSNGKAPLILSARNAHKTFVTAAAVLGIDVQWLYSKETGIVACKPDISELENRISELSPTAVYITSPDYIGNIADIEAISEVCRRHGVILAVDNAHGAYLKFLNKPQHPIDFGADICCDSAHKTLPALTGAGYLHVSKKAPEMFKTQAQNAMSLFASTSPSYLIMQSLDMTNKLISDGIFEKAEQLFLRLGELKSRLIEHGFELCGDEPAKLSVMPKSYGYTGDELSDILYENNIVCEFSDPDFCVLMFSPCTSEDDISKLESVLLTLPRRQPILNTPPRLNRLETAIPMNKAVVLPSVEIDVSDAVGRISASATVACPPAIPIAVCGERIDSSAVECFKYYGIKSCLIVDDRFIK